MLVEGVETFVVGNRPPSFGGRYFLVVRVVTDDGVEGVGEAYVDTFSPGVIADAIVDLGERYLVGRSPFDVETFTRRAYGTGFTLRPDPTVQGATSALEMACWDIIGKAVGQPVYNLLGGRVHERLRTYTYLYPEADDTADVYEDPDLAARRAVEAVEAGFTAVKFDPAGPYTVMGGHQPSLARLERCEAFVTAIRAAVGADADLLFGTHGQFTAAGALRVAARIEAADPLWFEEPVPPDDETGLARVVAGTRIPVATGERLTTAEEFARALAAGVGFVQPNLGRVGGILAGKKIAALAAVHGALLAPHCYCGPIVTAANAQLATCSPNFAILETIGDLGGFAAEVLSTPLVWEDGYVIPSDRPGLGIEVDWDVVRAHPYVGTELHLTMWDDPIDVADGPGGRRT